MRLMFVAAVLTLVQTAAADATKRGRAFEDQLLKAASPIFYPGGGKEHAPPLPIAWYVENCEVLGFPTDLTKLKTAVENGRELLTMREVVERSAADPDRWYRLTFRDANRRGGAREVTWDTTRIYGRVTEAGGGDKYVVQYFLLFGWNDTNIPVKVLETGNISGGPDPTGNHEGDWISVEFTVNAADPKKPKFLRGVFHNHGRQVFVDYGKSGFLGSGTRPYVFLEKGTNEPWPFASNEGIKDGDDRIPRGVSTSRRYVGIENVSTTPGRFAMVRTHAQDSLQQHIPTVVNVGSEAYGKAGGEVWFFHRFNGRYGSIWYRSPYRRELDPVSPRGPVYQPAVWDREHGEVVWAKD